MTVCLRGLVLEIVNTIRRRECGACVCGAPDQPPHGGGNFRFRRRDGYVSDTGNEFGNDLCHDLFLLLPERTGIRGCCGHYAREIFPNGRVRRCAR